MIYVDEPVNDGITLVGTETLKEGTVLEKDEANNYKALTDATKADAILAKKTTPTNDGVVTVAIFGGVVMRKEDLILPDGITISEIKPVLRGKGIYIKGA